MSGFVVASSRIGIPGESNLHLGYRACCLSKAALDGGTHEFVSLGELPSEWLSKVAAKAHVIYDNLVKCSASYVSVTIGEKISLRQAEILFGHLARIFAWRSARAELQVRMALDFRAGQTMLGTELAFPTPQDTSEAINLVSSLSYGAHLETLVFRANSGNEIDVVKDSIERQEETPGASSMFRTRLPALAGRSFARWTRSNEFALIDPRLGLAREQILSLLLGQLPVFPMESQAEVKRRVSELVSSGRLSQRPRTTGDPLTREFLRLLPLSLVEGKQALEDIAMKIGWPSSPRVIFTSNRFAFDDLFKSYVSKRIDETDYWVGQHGNNYFTSRETSICPELSTADKFLSWARNRERIRPVGQLFPSRISSKFKNRGVALILQGDLPSRTYCDWDQRKATYLDSIERLTHLLSQSGIKTVLCFAPGTSNEMKTWIGTHLADLPHVRISKRRLSAVLSRRLLPLFTYDSTGMLELSSRAKPFLVFLPEQLGHVNPEFSRNYDALREANLLAFEPETTLRLVKKALSNINRDDIRVTLRQFSRGIVQPANAKLPLQMRVELLRSAE